MRIPRLTTHAALLVTVSLALLTTPACILGFDADSVELQDPDDQDASGDLAADTAADTADEGVEDLPPDAPADTGADITPDAEPDITPDVEPDASPDMAPDDLPEDLPADADPDLPGDLADPDLAPDLVDPDLSPDLPGDLADAPDGEDPCPAGDACDPGFAGALGVCQDGACAFDRCEDGRGDCNNSLTIDGCEVSLESDVAHCGVCGRGCAAPNAEVSCAQGECQIASCAQGYEDLNRLAEDGCEAQRPMRARITGVDPINHGARVQWELVGEGAAPAWFELRWGTSPTNLEWSRRVPAARAVNLTATIGPLLEEGEWHFRVLTWSQEELSGELSEVFSEVWAPEGWFVRSPALFASALEAEGSAFGVYAGLGSVGHVLDGGAAVIPSHQAPPAAMFYLDMLYEGPEAGLGAMVGTDGQIQRTQDWGVSWASVSSPTTQDLSDVAITREGHLLVLGQGAQIHYSEDQGQRWGVVEETPPGVTLWTAAQALEVDGRRGPVYVTGAGEEEVVIGVVEGGRFEALPYAPTRLVYFFGLHMVTPEVGYAAGFQTLVRTQDGWRSHEVVELPDLLQEDILARVSASADGERVLVGSFYGNFWWSEDGGDSFVRVALPSLGNQEDNGWGAFAALGDQGGPPWLIMSSEGHRARWQPGQTGYALEGLAEGIWGDFVDAASAVDLRDILMLTEDGRVVQAAGTPDNVRGTQLLPGPRGATWRSLAYADTARIAVGTESAVATRIGAAQWTRVTLPDNIPDATLLDVELGDPGVGGWIVGNNPNGALLYHVAQSRLEGITLTSYGLRDLEPLGLGEYRFLDAAISADGTKHALLANVRESFRVWRGEGTWPNIDWERVYDGTTRTLLTLGFQEGSPNLLIAGDNGYLGAIDARGALVEIRLPVPPGRPTRLSGLALQGVLFPHDAEHGWVFSRDGWVARGAVEESRLVWRWEQPIFGGDTRPNAGLRALVFPSDNLHGVGVGPQGTAIWTANGGAR
jgi:hypothetical protein